MRNRSLAPLPFLVAGTLLMLMGPAGCKQEQPATNAGAFMVTPVPPGPPTALAPVEVRLMEHAGVRYDQGVRASSIRWPALGEAALSSQRQWMAIRDQVADPALKAETDAAVEGMGVAVAAEDGERAMLAVRRELDAVDRLERYFQAHPAAPAAEG